jgi:predicted ATPase
MKKESTYKNYIKEIFVKDLFGYYTYRIPKKTQKDVFHPMHIIYGDNGSGKTKILELLIYLLSTVDKAGRKSQMAKIKFSEFKVTLDNNTEVIATRSDFNKMSFDFIIKKNRKQLYKVPLIADSSGSITMQKQSKKEQIEFENILNFLKNLNISIFYVTDDRRTISGTSAKELEDSDYINENLIIRKRHIGYDKDILEEEPDELFDAIKKLETWIRRRVIQAARTGERNTNTIYSEIVKRITKSRKSNTGLDSKTTDLVKQLETLRKRSISYSQHGLISKVDSKFIEESLKTAKTDKLQIIYNVIEPYAEGIQTRLDSLQPIHELILSFTNSINLYFSNKILDYQLTKGFSIKHSLTKEAIDFKMLSSGERQLLLLVCYVITASDEATIFIIDEPEISLNVKWQRKLGETLLEFSKGKNVQFIIATHSIELLTGHQSNVCKLVSENVS